jgi:hypothetical protein
MLVWLVCAVWVCSVRKREKTAQAGIKKDKGDENGRTMVNVEK